nr:transglutaminase domain-containing protein [uncultured Carboxylicivirga sp.]
MNLQPIKTLLILFIICINATINAQDYAKIDSAILQYSDQKSSMDDLVYFIKNNFETDIEKSRAIFTWIAHHISYDVKKYHSSIKSTKKNKRKKIKQKNIFKYEQKVARTTYRKRSGICGDYSVLYKHLCDLTGVECTVISGYSKTERKNIGSKTGGKHAWNAVYINHQWQLLDVTWAAGYLSNDTFHQQFNDFYFFTKPDLFFFNHFPRKTEWVLTDKTREDFKNLPLIKSYFLWSLIDVDQPSNGTIKVEDNKITIHLKNTEFFDNITYTFINQGYGEIIKKKASDDSCRF